MQQGNRGDMRKIYLTRQFFEAIDLQGDHFKKKNLAYGLAVCVYQISGRYRLSSSV